jgi:membrane-associated phospholipid phosphatase
LTRITFTWLALAPVAVAWLTGSSVFATPLPQDSDQAKVVAPAESDAQVQPEIKLATKQRAPDDDDSPATSQRSLSSLGGDFLEDQRQIWTSPAKLRFSDTQWLVPLAGITAGLFVTDADFSRHLSHNPNTMSRWGTVSNAGLASLAGGAAGLWLFGHVRHKEHWSETGFLAGEAAFNSLALTESLKYSLRRDRPFQDDGSGSFFQSGGSSFPSEHAAVAWSIAGVVTHEYPGPLTKILAYSLASLVDFSRLRSRQHFPSDVFVGGVMGNLIAQNVYSRYHDADLGGSAWNSISSIVRQRNSTSRTSLGSPYVPLDSWIYPAFERLIAMNYINTAFLDMRPWTRAECARLISEAGTKLVDRGAPPEELEDYDALRKEFSQDLELLEGGQNQRAQLESVYTRSTVIAGQPLSQGYQYDFGQTLINDFGRPYEEGYNNVTGFSGWAAEGSLVAYVRGEYQSAPSAPALSSGVRQFISTSQELPEPPATPINATNRFQLLDAYVGMTLDNWQFTFGTQSLWWGPGEGGTMIMSNNAAPIEMFRIDRVSPFKLPWIFGWMGPIRVEAFIGRLTDHNFEYTNLGLVGNWSSPLSSQPMIDGERFTFKPTPNVEFGFSLTTLFAGANVPFTLHTYIKSIFSYRNLPPPNIQKPGNEHSAFDLSYRLPKLRNWLTFYCDGFTGDQLSPVAYWDRSAWMAGLYLARFPKLHKLDLRVEGVYSDLTIGGAVSDGFFYWNDRYRNGYTNSGNLIGSWIGREGQGAQAWSTYHFSTRSSLDLNFRHEKVSKQFLTDGGSLTDFAVKYDFQLRSNLGVSAMIQGERWLFPLITPDAQRNLATSIQVTYWPRRWGASSKN